MPIIRYIINNILFETLSQVLKEYKNWEMKNSNFPVFDFFIRSLKFLILISLILGTVFLSQQISQGSWLGYILWQIMLLVTTIYILVFLSSTSSTSSSNYHSFYLFFTLFPSWIISLFLVSRKGIEESWLVQWVDAWVKNVWDIFWQIALLILLITILSKICNKLSAAFRYFLWFIVLIRLCCPISITLPLTNLNIPSSIGHTVEQGLSKVGLRIDIYQGENPNMYSKPLEKTHPQGFPIPPDFGPENGSEKNKKKPPEEPKILSGDSRILFLKIFFVILWIAIFFFVVVSTIYRYFRTGQIIQKKCKILTPGPFFEYLQDLCKKNNIGTRIKLLQSRNSNTKDCNSYGVLHPCIILPSYYLNQPDKEEEIKAIIAHEFAHIKHFDSLILVLRSFLHGMHIFYPVIDFFNNNIYLESEQTCDDFAIVSSNISKEKYCRLLVDIASAETTRESYFGAVPMASKEYKTMRKRVTRILKTDYLKYRPIKPVSIISLILIGVCCFILASDNLRLSDMQKTKMRNKSEEQNGKQLEQWQINQTVVPDYTRTIEGQYTCRYPENVGMDSEYLQVFNSQLQYFYLNSVLIHRYGRTVVDTHGYPHKKNIPQAFKGCARGIISTLIGIAIHEGHLQGIQQTLAELFPNLKYSDKPSLKKQITIQNLLAMNSGFETRDNEDYDYEGTKKIMTVPDDWVQYIVNLPLNHTPGIWFAQSDLTTFLLSAIISKYTGMSALQYAEEKLFKPLEIKDYSWEANHQGISLGWGGLSLTPLAMAKIGTLYLQKGRWGNDQLIPQEWIIESLTPTKTKYAGDISNGYQWSIKEGEYFFLHGEGQYLFVAPGLDLVAVLTSNLRRDWVAIPRILFENIIMRSVLADKDILKLTGKKFDVWEAPES